MGVRRLLHHQRWPESVAHVTRRCERGYVWAMFVGIELSARLSAGKGLSPLWPQHVGMDHPSASLRAGLYPFRSRHAWQQVRSCQSIAFRVRGRSRVTRRGGAQRLKAAIDVAAFKARLKSGPSRKPAPVRVLPQPVPECRKRFRMNPLGAGSRNRAGGESCHAKSSDWCFAHHVGVSELHSPWMLRNHVFAGFDDSRWIV